MEIKEVTSTQTFRGKWVVDSETSTQYLVCIDTNKVILRKCSNGKVVPCGKILTLEELDGI
jgi:hypothetical protein